MLCFKPNYLIMLIPIYFQKLFHDNYIMWSIDAQYSIEFAPILTIGVFSVISKYKKRYLVNTLSAIVLIGTLISTIRTMDNTVVYTNKSKIRIYQPRHYKRNYNVMKKIMNSKKWQKFFKNEDLIIFKIYISHTTLFFFVFFTYKYP